MHAVAFEEVGGAICLPLDSKKGKTTRAMKILKEKGKRIFGDEVILTDGNLIYPFPIRLAVRPEVYTDFSEIKAQAFTRSLG
ncbi:hypothetical protein, partial [Pseudomonas sp. FW305-124]|uniref:hypothetical protein n=1 Tax=Pseudomonas sp. FW305-124 TaxID=2070649 RepID=UPI0011AF3083